MAEMKLSIADQVLANAIMALTQRTVSDDTRERMWLDVIGEVLGRANAAHPRVAPLIEAGEGMLAAREAGWRGCVRARALFEASQAGTAFAEWRAGLAINVFREERAA